MATTTSNRWRPLLAIPVVVTSSTAAATCIIHPYWIQLRAERFASMTGQFAGLVTLSSIVTVLAFAAALAGSTYVGSAPSLAIGTASAVFGVLVGREVRGGDELLFVCLALGLGGGALAGGGLSEAVRSAMLSTRPRGVLMSCWVLPFVLVWPWTTIASRHQAPRLGGRVAPALPVWLVVVIATVLIAWSVVALLTDSGPTETGSKPPAPTVEGRTVVGGTWGTAARQQTWFGICLAAGVAALFAIALTTDLEAFPEVWIQPTVLVGSGLAVGCLVVAGASIEAPSRLQAGFPCVAAACLTAPAVLTFVVAHADDRGGRLGPGPLLVLIATGILSGLAGWRAPARFVVLGPALAAIGCVPAWVMPRHDWPMVLTAIPVIAGLSAAVAGAVTLIPTAEWWLLGLAVVVCVLIGASFIPGLFAQGLIQDTRPLASGRVALGCSLAGYIAALAAAHLGQRRVTRETEVTIT